MSLRYVFSDGLKFFRIVCGLLLPEKAVSLTNFQPHTSTSKNLLDKVRCLRSQILFMTNMPFLLEINQGKKNYRHSICLHN